MRRSLELHRLGDWTDDARRPVVFPQDSYPENAGPHDHSRAVLRANHRRPRDPARQRPRPLRLVLSCIAAVLALGFVQGALADTWRGLTVAPERRCAPYHKKRDYPYPQSVEEDIVRELGSCGKRMGMALYASSRTESRSSCSYYLRLR